MREQLIALMARMQNIAFDVRPGGQGEIEYKQAVVELQSLIDAPEPQPKTVIQTEIVTGDVANQVAENIQVFLSAVQESLIGLTARLTNVESATASILNAGQATSEKIDGVVTTLAEVKAQTTPAAA